MRSVKWGFNHINWVRKNWYVGLRSAYIESGYERVSDSRVEDRIRKGDTVQRFTKCPFDKDVILLR